MIHQERIKQLNTHTVKEGKYILYWMQQSQRTEYNHALEYAIDTANRLALPVVVFFGLSDSYPEARERHYKFMLQGLAEVQESLEKRRIQLVIQYCSPPEGAISIAENAAALITDRGYLPLQRQWRAEAASKTACPFFEVESDVVVPIEVVSGKEEYTAGTLRPKLQKVLSPYLASLEENNPDHSSLSLKFKSIGKIEVETVLKKLHIPREAAAISWIQGGTAHAKELLHEFINSKLKYYDSLRNDPARDYSSHMSPYLHFGQISPLYIALQVNRTNHSSKKSFLEELIVRRELSMNFVFYNEYFDTISSLPRWALDTLQHHSLDKRPYVYSLDELEEARTHDPYWNAAQKEMVILGKMHGYMRMYWGKKIIEWTESPEDAYKRAIYLNNKYLLDGRDANGYTGVAWCFGKHDRAWKERPVFGKVRYMNDRGLERKFAIKDYVKRIETLELYSQ